MGDRSDDEVKIASMQHRLDEHIENYETRVVEEERRWEHLLEVTEKNQESISKLCESTQGMVEAWQAANGAIRVGLTFGRFVKWCTQVAIIGVAVKWLLDNFGS